MRTRTSGTELLPTNRTRRQGGFTLFELLAVLTIIALIAAAISFRGGKSFGTAQFRAVLTSTSVLLRQARSRAISTARSVMVVVDLDHRRLAIPDTGQTFSIPPDIDLLATVADSERYPDGTVGIRFFGDGTSTGGTLAYAWGSQHYQVRVNWLTGNVAIDQG